MKEFRHKQKAYYPTNVTSGVVDSWCVLRLTEIIALINCLALD